MRERVDASAGLLKLAELQAGVVSREQAVGHGLGRHSIARLTGVGLWQRLDRGIYLTAPRADREIDWLSQAWAGILIGGDTARLGGLAAAFLHRLVDNGPERILVYLDQNVRRQHRDVWQFRRQLPGKETTRPRGAPPRIGVEDLVLDLIDNGSDDDRRRGAAHWVSTAIQRRLTTRNRLARALNGRRLIHDRRIIEELLADVADGAETPLELRYLQDVERAHRLPTGRRQAVRRTARFESTIRAYRDVYYDEFGLVVELDGRTGHVDEGRLRDLHRDNVATLRGERTLRYGWIDVTEEPCLTAFQVAGGLRRGGWNGLPGKCPRCRAVPDDELAQL